MVAHESVVTPEAPDLSPIAPALPTEMVALLRARWRAGLLEAIRALAADGRPAFPQVAPGVALPSKVLAIGLQLRRPILPRRRMPPSTRPSFNSSVVICTGPLLMPGIHCAISSALDYCELAFATQAPGRYRVAWRARGDRRLPHQERRDGARSVQLCAPLTWTMCPSTRARPLRPWLTTATRSRSTPSPITRVNGELRQDSNTRNLFDCDTLVEQLTVRFTSSRGTWFHCTPGARKKA